MYVIMMQESKFMGIFSWESIWNFVAVVLGIVLAFTIDRWIEARKKKSVQKTLVSLIADEVERNIDLMNAVVEKSIVPYFQLETQNKESCWSALVEHPFTDRALIQSILRSYFEYRFINRTLDMIFFKEGVQSPLFGTSTFPLCQAEIERSRQLLARLRAFANS